MLTQIRIFSRLIILMVVMLGLMVGIAIVGYSGLHDMEAALRTVYLDRVVPMQQLRKITTDYYNVRIEVVSAIGNPDLAAAKEAVPKIEALVADAEKEWQAYIATYLTPEEKQLVGVATEKFAAYDAIRGKVLGALMAGDRDTARTLAKQQAGPALAALMASLDSLSNLQVDVANEEFNKGQQVSANDEMMLYGGLALAVLLGGCIAIAIARSVTVPLRGIIGVMHELTAGNLTVAITGGERKDEIGDVARAVNVFKDGLLEAHRLREEQEAAKKQAEAVRRQMMVGMADRFEASVGAVLGAVTDSADKLQMTAQAMSATAEQTTRQSTAVATASEQTTNNVQTVASAAEELSASITEITTQVSESTRIVGQAVEQADSTNSSVKSLSEAAQKIGAVVQLINDIAGQTNLLALNATIEAARAGEAGKGFAVVASEVKALATQTARATDEISGQIRSIQDASTESAQAIAGITVTISRVNEISTTIASAVEEQGAATLEISRSVQQAAQGTQQVSNNISNVTEAARETGRAAADLLHSAGELARNGALLKEQVDEFLREVRA
ncbi:MAG: MCP four helix bundle domain-containing protein [Proteobacteria bacterium]|nr:MCP four helix bundle domain-containing protein [Pseudomonadota bacterium]